MKRKQAIQRRNKAAEQITYRKMALGNGGPVTANPEARTVDVVAATESPVLVFDPQRWEVVREVLLMDGARLPKSRKVPLLDNHNRYSNDDVLGSARNLRVEGDELRAEVLFSSVERADQAMVKVVEGHISDFSLGYRVEKSIWIPEKQTQVVNGRSFTGPVKIATQWVPRELSATPIGADERATARSNKMEGGSMDEKFRNWLIRKGMDPNATDEQALAFLEGLDAQARTGSPVVVPQVAIQPATVTPQVDVEAEREAARVEELGRVREIRAMGERFGLGDLAEQMIEGRKSVDDARRAILDQLSQRQAPAAGGFRPAIEMQQDERDKFRAASMDSLLIRGGIVIESPAPGAQDLRGFSLRELAREALRIAGQPVGGDVREMVGRALTTSDLPYIMSNVANKSLFAGWDQASETWQVWCDTGSVSDFKQASSVRPSEMDDLAEIPEAAEYTYSGASEGKEVYQIATYGKIFAITRQAIINDDLGALTNTPKLRGEAAARKVGDVAYAVLTANAAMGDGIALFHASHANLGTAGVVSVTTIGEGEKLMGLQKDIGGKRRLNISPQFFIAPKTIKAAAEIFFKTLLIGGVANQPNLQNIYADAFTRVYESRLDDSSTTAYYLAGPKGKTVTVFFLNGQQAPYLETKEGWTVDGVEYKVRIDACAKALDWKGLVKNAGA